MDNYLVVRGWVVKASNAVEAGAKANEEAYVEGHAIKISKEEARDIKYGETRILKRMKDE